MHRRSTRASTRGVEKRTKRRHVSEKKSKQVQHAQERRRARKGRDAFHLISRSLYVDTTGKQRRLLLFTINWKTFTSTDRASMEYRFMYSACVFFSSDKKNMKFSRQQNTRFTSLRTPSTNYTMYRSQSMLPSSSTSRT